MSKKAKQVHLEEDLDDSVLLNDVKEEPVSEESEDESIVEPAPKPKRQLTERQKEALAAGRAKGRERLDQKHAEINERRQARMDELAKMKEEAEQRVQKVVVKKAVAIKKRELMQQIRLDEIEDDSNDDIPVEIVRKIIAKQRQKQQAPNERKSSVSTLTLDSKKPTPVPHEPEYKPAHRYNPTEAYGYQKPIQAKTVFNFV